MWRGDRCDYVPWLQDRLFPEDRGQQARVSWLIYGEGWPLTYEPDTDLAAIRACLATPAFGKENHGYD
jgi:hypothetical protein